MSDKGRGKLVGVVVSIPTFCSNDYEILYDRLGEHIRWLTNHGLVEGEAVLMAGGGMGEGYFFTEGEFKGVVDVLAEAAQGRVPTMVGVFELSARVAAAKAKYAAQAGIDFIQVNPPHYMLPSDEEVFAHYQRLNDAADIGIMVYNTPWAMPRPGYEITPGLLERLAGLENVVGVKWCSYNFQNLVSALRLFAERLNFIDNQGLFSLGYKLGMKGFIDFWANAAPRLSLKLWELARTKQYDELDELYLKVHFDPFVRQVSPEQQLWVGMGEGSLCKLWMKLAGVDPGPPFPAQAPVSDALHRAWKRTIEASGILDWVEKEGG